MRLGGVAEVVRGAGGGREREMGEGVGEKGRDVSQQWGPMQGCRRWRAGRRGWRGYRVLQGAQAGHGWQRSIPPVCGHAMSQPCDAQSRGGVGQVSLGLFFSEFKFSRQTTHSIPKMFFLFFCFVFDCWICCEIKTRLQWEVNPFYPAVELRLSTL